VNLARPVVEQLDEYGETRRGWLGVNIQEVTPDIADSLGRPNSNGALVVSVTKTGPADGIIDEGDLILEFNGKPIEKMRDLSRFVAESAVGSKASVKLLRAGKEISLDITLGRLEAADAIEASAKEPKVAAPDGDPDEPVGPPPGLKDMVGLDLAPIDAELRKTYALEADAKGLVITDVVTGSGAEDAGLVKGLVVSEVNEQKIETVADVIDKVNAAKEAGRPAVLFKVTDATGGSRFIAVRLAK
jgi:serine protease Do